jgi:hypothetical protein
MRTIACGRAMLDTLGAPMLPATAVWNAAVFVKSDSIGKFATAVQTGHASLAPTAHQIHTTRGQVIRTLPTTASGSATLDTADLQISVFFATLGNSPLEALAPVQTAKPVMPMHIRVAVRVEAPLTTGNVRARKAFRAVVSSAYFVVRGNTSLALG